MHEGKTSFRYKKGSQDMLAIMYKKYRNTLVPMCICLFDLLNNDNHRKWSNSMVGNWLQCKGKLLLFIFFKKGYMYLHTL